MRNLRAFFRFIYRLAAVWLVDTVSLIIMAAIISGIDIQAVGTTPAIVVAVAAAFLLGLVNIIVRPIILLLALPFGFIVILLAGFLMNAIVLKITAGLLPGFAVSSWWVAFVGGLVFSAVNTILTNVMTVDDEGSFFESLVERLAKRNMFPDPSGPGQGVVMLEIDGLSYHHMKKALDEGFMPNLSRLIKEYGYQLSRVETGIPSMTSACQAGILYGDNYDIPSFRWFDRDLNQFLVSSNNADLLEKRYSTGQALIRGGSSIGNMLSGDAQKSLFVLGTMKTDNQEEKKRRAQDIYLLMLNPYFFVRTLIFFFWDVIVEIWQYFRQVRQNVQPRLNRLHNGYPLMRAGLTSFLMDVSAYMIILDIIRGSPAIYHTYAGYDEMAHHAGPWTRDAFNELRRFDRVIGRILRTIQEKAPRPYELLILSDHGQSFGATFLQRYGVSLKDFIEQHLPQGTSVSGVASGDDGTIGVISMMNELENIQEQGVGGGVGQAMVGQADKLMQRGLDLRTGPEAEQAADVKVAFSGNLANVYFGQFPQRAKLSELNAAYPGMVDALVQHEGVGFVVAYDDFGDPIAFGKDGARNLHSRDVTGEDPLKPFGDVSLRAEQVRRVADFPHAGDLIVNSTLYPDGTVAAMEELIGNHGGIGGEQTDAFIFHPDDMQVPETKNSLEVFGILDARRDLVLPLRLKAEIAEEGVNAWAWSTLVRGLGRVGTWLGRAVRALILDRSAYKEVAADAYMTGPALLIILLITILTTFVYQGEWDWLFFGARLVIWFVVMLVTFGTGRLIGGKGDFTPAMRGMGFAQSAFVLALLGLIPNAAPLARLITSLLVFVTTWMGASQALQLRGWRTIILPFVAVLGFFVAMLAFAVLFAGAKFTLTSLGVDLGILPPP